PCDLGPERGSHAKATSAAAALQVGPGQVPTRIHPQRAVVHQDRVALHHFADGIANRAGVDRTALAELLSARRCLLGLFLLALLQPSSSFCKAAHIALRETRC